MTASTSIVWFRRDLRLSDNPALRAAIKRSKRIIPLFVWAPEEETPWQPGEASRWWLHHSLEHLSKELSSCGSCLTIRKGGSEEEILKLIEETNADSVFWNRLYDPQIVERDKELKSNLKSREITVESFPGYLLTEPWDLTTGSKKPYKVFTPYWSKLKQSYQHIKPAPKPKTITTPDIALPSLELKDLELLPELDWDTAFYDCWRPGEKNAKGVLKSFLKKKTENYQADRDHPALDATSKLAAHLHFGEITPAQVWEYSENHISKNSLGFSEVEPFLRQLAWRDFSHQLLFNFPETDKQPLRPEFRKFPWKADKRALDRWQKGQTGYPLVDAGMRQLWATGTMHNRVRMIVASFLVKHLLIRWQDGAEWFWDTLVDANLANNTMGWQWTAGCGADAAPYFRVFNPIAQGERFDADGEYIRKWIPELSQLPKKWIHKPWEAQESVLDDAGISLGKDYPMPIVEHREGRERALEAYEDFKEN